MGSSGNIRSVTASKSRILTLKWHGFWSPRAHSKYQTYSWCLASGEGEGGGKKKAFVLRALLCYHLLIVTTDFACWTSLQILKFGMFLVTQANKINICYNNTKKYVLKSSVIQARLPQPTPGYSKLKWMETFWNSK